MRTLWIAGLGAVLISGGAAAQGVNAPATPHGALTERPTEAPDQTLRAQDPRLSQGRLSAPTNLSQPAPVPPALQNSPNQQQPDRTVDAQDPRLQQQRLPARQNVQSGGTERPRAAQTAPRGVTAQGRTDAPRNPADRAYMGGGMILENGRPVPLPGDAPGMASDFRGQGMPQSTATGRTGAGTGMGGAGTPGGHDSGAQTNVGQTGTNDQGMVGSPQGAFPANPPIPGGRVPTGN